MLHFCASDFYMTLYCNNAACLVCVWLVSVVPLWQHLQYNTIYTLENLFVNYCITCPWVNGGIFKLCSGSSRFLIFIFFFIRFIHHEVFNLAPSLVLGNGYRSHHQHRFPLHFRNQSTQKVLLVSAKGMEKCSRK